MDCHLVDHIALHLEEEVDAEDEVTEVAANVGISEEDVPEESVGEG